MRKRVIVVLTIIISSFYGCCGGFGTGPDCTNYKANRQIFIRMNMDSTNNGFKISELDSTYFILYESDSINPFAKPIDTVTLFNSTNVSNYSPYNRYDYGYYLVQENLKTGSYSLKKGIKIYNTHSSIINELSNFEIELKQNEKKCCDNYSDDNIKSYKLNGVQKFGYDEIIINKK